ncbi:MULTISPECIES: hypothetical protein [Pseudomonas]|uniref:Uncharacterized protein n=1 Tax=Pseudomonas asiatica TaxID=2219225 RepID=A0A9X4D7G7_9PSED|nr:MULTISPECIES: hypothetical protein [Pseudomonas]MCO6690419.1 hypothetical protein [Pseudomonas shirazica]AGA72935.1 hypothetical protein B479_10165 [Pseudomonas putida HB3267]MCE0946463.1 hypothetical protein [Pseudomonas asiatica]MCE1033058.1 hypothetical protein [Pseudomonas asiatica]MCE1067585.1 hypothetical protein [Pseudomonas asiatica]
MSELTINVDDYLSESDKRRIVTDAFSAAAAAHAQKDFERIISNSAYYLVGEIVDQHFDGNMVATLKDKAISVINNLSSSTVFSPPNAWDRAASKGFEHMQSALDELKPMIHQRVHDLIARYNSEELRSLIEEQIGDAIIKKLTS